MFAAQPTLVATQETKFSLTTAVQAPFKPDTARMEISRVNNADQIDVWHTAPTMNSIGFKKADYAASTAGDGGGKILHTRYEWSTTSSYLTSTSFDAYNSMSGANYLPCNTPGPCAFPLGAEVQAISVYSSTSTSLDTSCGTTHGVGNKCQFQIAFGAFSEKACVVGACATNLDTTTNVLTVNEDIKAKLPTGAQFMVDKHGAAPCTFTVANTQATATEVTVLAGHGCSIGAGAYSVHVQKSTDCLDHDISAADLQTKLNGLDSTVNDDVLVTSESIDMSPGLGLRWHITFTGSAVSGDVPSAVLLAIDQTGALTNNNGGCKRFNPASKVQAIVTESLKGGVLTAGTPYYAVSYTHLTLPTIYSV